MGLNHRIDDAILTRRLNLNLNLESVVMFFLQRYFCAFIDIIIITPFLLHFLRVFQSRFLTAKRALWLSGI